MVTILGCDHYLQEYELQDWQGEIRSIERRLKEKFYSITEEIIREKAIGFIAEECKPGQKTIARVLAAENGCRYSEIDMGPEQRCKAGIPKDYEKLGDEERTRCYAIRERYMLERTYSESTTETAKLIVCGAQHVDSLAVLFSEREQDLTTRNVLKEDWCVLPWDKMMRRGL